MVLEQIDKNGLSENGQPLITGVPTGFPELDRITLGMQAGELIVIGARPGNGGYAFVLNVILNVATGSKLPVVFFSLTNTPDEVGLRLLALASNLDSYQLRTGRLTDVDWKAISVGVGCLHDAPIAIESLTGGQLDTMLDLARQYHSGVGGRLGLVVIDDFQAFGFDTSSACGRDAGMCALWSVRKLAEELGTPVLILSQLDAQVEKRRDKHPLLCDLPRSSLLDAIADAIWLLYRPSYYEVPSPPDAAAVQIDLCIAKSRQDYEGICQLSFSGNSLPTSLYWGRGL